MPDALSKTVPIWCCVLNRVLFPSESFSHALFVPPRVVSDSERSQIEARVPSFVTSCKDLALDLEKLQMHIKKPLRPVWRTPDDEGEAFLAMLAHVGASGFHPVVCCTSSHRVVGAEMSEAGYVQGAGDDTENWALGLTAPVFWAHADELAQTAEADLPGLIAALVAADREADVAGRSGRLRQLAPRVAVAALPLHEETLTGTSCLVMLVPRVTEQKTWVKSKTRLEVGLGKGKVASRTLRLALPQICDFVSTFLASPGAQGRQVVVACDTAKDLSIGVGLALVCWCFDDEGRPVTKRPVFTKALVKVRLGRIMTAMPDANPSRATLQSVNGFLMDWRA